MTGRVALTGATGFIGRHVATRLLAQGHEVVIAMRPESRHAPPAGVLVVRTPLEAAALRTCFAGVDAVIHLAGIVAAVRDDEYRVSNVEGTRAVAVAARDVGARLVHVSSLAAAGPSPASAPRSEGDPPAPINAYGASKLESERVVAATTDLAWTILRPGAVYGPGDRAVLPLFQYARLGILPLVGRADAAYTFIHVTDLARAIEAALAADRRGDTFFVGHPVPVTAREILEHVRTAVGRRAAIVPVPLPVLRVAALAGEIAGRIVGHPMAINQRRLAELVAEGFVCRVDRLKELLGVVAEIGLREGMAETAAWYRMAGWL